MSEWCWRVNAQSKAINAQKKAIASLKIYENFSATAMALFERNIFFIIYVLGFVINNEYQIFLL